MKPALDGRAEWLEADGLGGFASGTVSGVRTRRYHALLLVATTPPTGRHVLVNGCDAWLETPAGLQALSSQRYTPEVVHPDGHKRLEAFEADPWPLWIYRLEDGTRVEQSVFVPKGAPIVAVSWRLLEPGSAGILRVRPFLSGRDYHSLHHENAALHSGAEVEGERVKWRPYESVPAVVSLSNGEYAHAPEWYRNFLYEEERDRGLDFSEDLLSPGSFRFDLSRGEAVWILAADGEATTSLLGARGAAAVLAKLRATEKRRRGKFKSRLHKAADAYLVKRGQGQTVVAGYPWFTDWGRDTFIAMRGLCLATGRRDEARDILLEWSHAVSEGMLPNRFSDSGDEPEFNSVDAALWYVVAVHDFLRLAKGRRRPSGRSAAPCPACGAGSGCLEAAVQSILEGLARGTRHGIRMDDDGLLAAGAPGVQLTWMDAKLGDWVVTPRMGKPVEIQALWLNALRIGSRLDGRWQEPFAKASASFAARFWNEESGCLHDVVDAGAHAGAVDSSFRPNQILAVGGLPYALLEGDRARRVVDAVEKRLWTPLGLRSLARDEAGYAPRYAGGVRERDGAYHQGTVWPWLIGPFVEAWVRVRNGSAEARAEARRRFLAPLLRHLDEAGIGHVSEIADGDAPHTPRGCPFQAWSVGELLRLDLEVLSEKAGGRGPSSRRSRNLAAPTASQSQTPDAQPLHAA